MTTTSTTVDEARRLNLGLARYAAEAGNRTGAMRQIVRRLRELDTPEADIQEATGLTAEQLELLVAKADTERASLTDARLVVDYPPTDPRNASVQALLALGEIHQDQQRLNARLPDAVIYARAAGASWEMIGAMLGMSRQSAQERFGKLDQRAS